MSILHALGRHLRARRELGRRGLRSLGAAAEVERRHALRRNRAPAVERNNPVRSKRLVVRPLAPLEYDAVSVDRHQHTLPDAVHVHLRHLLRRRAVEVGAVEAVFPARNGELVPTCTGTSDRGELTLPNALLVRQRLVLVPRERKAVGIAVQGLARQAPVKGLDPLFAAQEPRCVCRVLHILVLDVEERPILGEIERGQELRQRRTLVFEALGVLMALLVAEDAHPVAQNERVPLHGLRADRLVVLAEAALPNLLLAPMERFGLRLVKRLVPASGECVLVVVSGHEKLLDAYAVRTSVIREDLPPGTCHRLELAPAARGREIPGDQHGVDLAAVVEAQRLLEEIGVVVPRDVDVRKNPHDQVGPCALRQGGQRRVRRLRHGRRHKRRPCRTEKEFASVHFYSSLLFMVNE